MKPRLPSFVTRLDPYDPGKTPETLAAELGLPRMARLHANENPLGPSPRAVEAAREALARMHHYPDGGAQALRERIATLQGVPVEGVVVGNGSDELIGLIAQAFVRHGDVAVVPEPSFVCYRIHVEGRGASVIAVPLRDYRLDWKALAGAVTEETTVLFVNNPNNPTGTVLSKGEFEALLAAVPRHLVVVADEAYSEFARPGTTFCGADYARMEGPWVVSLRTTSKAYACAGFRVGWGVMHPEIAGALNRLRLPYNVGLVAQAAALAAINDEEHLAATLRFVWDEVDRVQAALSALGIGCIPTQANFICMETPVEAPRLARALAARGLLVRSMADYGLPRHIRINIGTRDENDAFLAALPRCVREAQGA